jgi:hypothetical protein
MLGFSYLASSVLIVNVLCWGASNLMLRNLDVYQTFEV